MRRASGHRDAILIYAGLRRQEALNLHRRDFGERTIVVNAPKTGERRNVRLLEPLREDLDAWRGAQLNVRKDGVVFPGQDGERWAPGAYKSWARKAAAGAPQAVARRSAAAARTVRSHGDQGRRSGGHAVHAAALPSARCCCTRGAR